jgi:hypothetical protein
MAALVPIMFCNFYKVKNFKIALSSTMTVAKGENNCGSGILKFLVKK